MRLVERHPGGPADYPILRRYRSRYRYYYFYIRDQVLGAMVVRVGTFIPFEASYYLNGHQFIEQELLPPGWNIQRRQRLPFDCRHRKLAATQPPFAGADPEPPDLLDHRRRTEVHQRDQIPRASSEATISIRSNTA